MRATPGSNPAVWESEAEQPELCAKLREALCAVTDPEIGLNIIQLGLIRNVKIEADQAIIRMILTTPFCPYGPAMLEETRQKAEAALERPVFMDLGMEAWDFGMMTEDLGADWGLY
ncbi:MAG TPA: iron-sulfur cluster assembly protein [Anaerolineaceae bacterium]|nr:iron-sulfur cluster assembly protein [Anaerolineaceae bacterium]HNS37502.1 iron-sulfur cluster assembly protein [Anaerolineaceae bacterium]